MKQNNISWSPHVKKLDNTKTYYLNTYKINLKWYYIDYLETWRLSIHDKQKCVMELINISEYNLLKKVREIYNEYQNL